MQQELFWFGGAKPVGKELLGAVAACEGRLMRCFFKRGRPGKRTEQRLWFQNPVTVVEVDEEQWRLLRSLARRREERPAFWNGQDAGNIFHLLVSFLGRLWLHLHAHFHNELKQSNSLLYVFDLHAGRAGMFSGGAPLVPGYWASEFLRAALPAVEVAHADALAKEGPLLFKRMHFNLVNWGSWVLPSEDLYPPRISRREVGPHPLLQAMPLAVKRSLGVDEAEGAASVLLLRRSPPAGRRLTNEESLLQELSSRGLTVKVADLSVMLFAAQVEAVAHAAVLVGAHGQGLFNLIFLPKAGGVVEVPPCGLALALVYNVAELFGLAFAEILDSSCDEAFMRNFTAMGCQPCRAREVKTAGRAEDLDSAHVGDCGRMHHACDVRSAQSMTLNNVSRAAGIVFQAHGLARQRLKLP